MARKLTYEELEAKVLQLENDSAQRQRFEQINAALFKIANAVNTTSSKDELFNAIHSALSHAIDTTNFYIALYDKSSDGLSFPYIVDSVDEYYPSVVEVSKTASLTAEVLRTGKPLLIHKPEILHKQAVSTLKVPDCTPSETWLGVPLNTKDEIVGIMAVQSYSDPQCYDQTDMEVMVAVADQVAIALDHRLKEEELIESEARFRCFVATANEGIMSLNADWRIVYTNAHFAKMLGYEPEELPGKRMEILIRDEDLNDFLIHKQERIGGISRNFERIFKTKQGSFIHTIVSATPMMDHEGQFAGSFGMITDITALKNTEEKLHETIIELKKAADQIRTLRGIVPICMHCKKIRDDQGFWNQVDVYVRNHTEAEFSHGVCPDCIHDLYPDIATTLSKTAK